MASDTSGTITFLIPERFDQALRTIRLAVEKGRLKIASELDVSRRVERNLGIRLPPCRILYTWPSAVLARDISAWAALFLPLHVVVSERGLHTAIYLPNRVPCEIADTDGDAFAAVSATHREVLRSIETVAMRLSVVSWSRSSDSF